MDDNRIDHLLAGEDNIEPSREFAAAVMAAVRSEAAGHELLRFPWRLAWPGLAGVGLCTAVLGASLLLPAAAPAQSAPGRPDIVEQLLANLFDLATSASTVWVALACVFTLLTVQLSMQFIHRASH